MNFQMIKSLISGANDATPVETMSAETALKFHGDKDTVFVDVRSLGEIKTSGTVRGAIKAPLPEFVRHALPDGRGSLPSISANKRIICVCASGARSGAAAQQLRQLGYTQVANLNGGIGTWLRAGGPTER